MSKKKRMFWLVTALFVTSGCSSYRAASLSGVATDPDAHEGHTVQKGDWVKVTMVDDDDVVGTVVDISPQELVVASGAMGEIASDPLDHAVENATVIPVTSIRTLEVRKANVGASVLVMGVLVGSVIAMATVDIDMDIEMSGSTVPSSPRWTGR